MIGKRKKKQKTRRRRKLTKKQLIKIFDEGRQGPILLLIKDLDTPKGRVNRYRRLHRGGLFQCHWKVHLTDDWVESCFESSCLTSKALVDHMFKYDGNQLRIAAIFTRCDKLLWNE